MKTFAPYLFLLIFSVAFFSCAEEKEMELEPGINIVEFDNLKIGDIMLYSYQTGYASLESGENSVAYTGDTLELNVINEIDGKFLIQEQITPGSAIFDSEEKYIFGELEEPIQFLWEIHEDSVFVTESEPEAYFQRGHLISGLQRFSLKEITSTEVELDGWRTSLPEWYSGIEFFIKNGELNSITYPHLNAIVNFGPMAYDADGYINIYNKEKGIIRTSTISAWTSRVHGWDRIN